MGNNTFFHHTFDYPVKTEGETLEHTGPYGTHMPFVAESHLRPDGYGSLDQQLFQSMPLAGHKYSRFSPNPNFDHQPGSALSIASLESSCGSSSTSPGSASSSFLYPPSTTYSTNGSNFVSHYSPAASTGYSSAVNYPPQYCPFVYDNRAGTTFIPSSSGMPPPSPSSGNHSSGSPPTRRDYADPGSQIPRYPTYDAHGLPVFGTNTSYPPGLTAPRSIISYNTMSSSASQSAYGPSSTSQGAEASSHFPTLVSQNSVPPFDPTRMWAHKIVAANGTSLQVDLQAKIDKGFFKADQDWTCYRRNYFAVQCSYTLKPYSPKLEPLSLRKTARETSSPTIRSFAICISARIDSEEGKLIDLVQHTPKRDKGPTGRPEKIKLHPLSSSNAFGILPEHGGGVDARPGLSADYEPSYAPSSPAGQQSQTVATFDRIQFKNATANNGKRRAAQQYFHIVVELFAEIPSNQTAEGTWTKVASRLSAPMVVRGRSPGHYSDDRRGSSTSMGPGGGSTGESSGSQQDPHSGSSGVGRSSVAGMFNAPLPRLGGGGSGNQTGHHASSDYAPGDNVSDRSSSTSDYEDVEMVEYERPKETVLTPEEEDNIENHEGYQYYPSTLLAAPAVSNVPRPVLLNGLGDTLRSGTNELSSSHEWYNGSAPASDNLQGQGGLGRLLQPDASSRSHPHPDSPGFYPSHVERAGGPVLGSNGIRASGCGRFHGVDTSRGHYPETPAW